MKREPKSNINQKETIYRNKDFIGNTMALSAYLSIVTLSNYCKWAKCSNQSTQGIRLDKKATIYCLQEIHFRPKDTSRFKVRE